VAAGGCVAWICNTVQRAQSSFEYLRQLRDEGVLEGDTDLCLLHSRFLRKDRQRLERRAEELYGPKGSARPFRGILVGTQVLEQSLDLDFDLMLTDLAPIDLVLQRAGRLHRHVRQRPAPHVSPTLWLVMPDLDHGCPNFASVAGVYEADVMSRTWWELQGTRAIDIPAELETWVERVYGDLGSTPADPELAARLAHAADETREKRRADWNKAQTNLLFPPEVATTEDPFGNVYTDLKEDERGDVHPDLRAQTRLAEPSSDVVCLWDTARGISLTEDGTQIVDLEAPASIATARAFIEHSLRLENRKLCQVQGVIREPAPWREQSTLRHKKVLLLGDEAARLGFRLDPELGLVSGQGSERQQTRTLPRGEDQ
jgi:CRISPR-associated endonuclease/helicase Cas3